MLTRLSAALLAGGALIASASLASAADLPARPRAVAAPVFAPAPVYTWTGFYVGGNVGYAWSNSSVTSFTSNLEGVTGGGQLGYNWQTGNLLLGIEGDFQGSGQYDSSTGTVGGTTVTVERRIPWYATLRGRVGVTNGPWLFYFTGGGAWLNNQLSTTAGGVTVSDNSTTTAWTIGGGAEWMFAPRWSAKLEYLYLRGREQSVTVGGNTYSGRAEDNVVRVGLNYHF
jgi:outer membrane immunogenic protein